MRLAGKVRMRAIGTSVLVALVWPVAAQACTVCDSRIGHQVRAGLFNREFLHTFLLVGLPFPVLLLGVFAVCMVADHVDAVMRDGRSLKAGVMGQAS